MPPDPPSIEIELGVTALKNAEFRLVTTRRYRRPHRRTRGAHPLDVSSLGQVS
jgi:hypothetical protein